MGKCSWAGVQAGDTRCCGLGMGNGQEDASKLPELMNDVQAQQ